MVLGVAVFAAALAAQTQQTTAGTVTGFTSLAIGIKTGDGAAAMLKFGPETQVMTLPPGERDLTKATPAAVTDIVLGDRIMTTFVAGLTPARWIVLITGRDILPEPGRDDRDEPWRRGEHG